MNPKMNSQTTYYETLTQKLEWYEFIAPVILGVTSVLSFLIEVENKWVISLVCIGLFLYSVLKILHIVYSKITISADKDYFIISHHIYFPYRKKVYKTQLIENPEVLFNVLFEEKVNFSYSNKVNLFGITFTPGSETTRTYIPVVLSFTYNGKPETFGNLNTPRFNAEEIVEVLKRLTTDQHQGNPAISTINR